MNRNLNPQQFQPRPTFITENNEKSLPTTLYHRYKEIKKSWQDKKAKKKKVTYF